jgi:hypothetical protein
MSLQASRVLIVDQVERVCQQTGVSESTARANVTDDALAAMADSAAFSLVEEFPGADLHNPCADGSSATCAGRTYVVGAG